MSHAADDPVEPIADGLFDVVVRVPPGARLSDIEHRALDAGIRPDRVEVLVKALRSQPEVKIGAGVKRERADKARDQYSKAGLAVEVLPMQNALNADTGKQSGRMHITKSAGASGGLRGVLRLGALTGLLAAAFLVGRSGALEKLLAKTPEAPPVAAADMQKLLQGQTGAAQVAGDTDIDDPLIQAASGNRTGAKGMSLEQAVAAAHGLAPGTASPARTGVPAGTSASGGDGAPVPDETRHMLSIDFALQLAEMGQLPRASGVIRALKARAGTGPLAGLVRVAELEVQAWVAQTTADGRKAAEALMAAAGAVQDPQERTRAMTRIGIVISRNVQLPTDVSRAFFTQATESLKLVADTGKANAAASDWAVGLGEATMTGVIAHVRAGGWSRAKAAAAQIAELIRHAPDSASQLRLHAMDYAVQQQLGNEERALEALDAALVLAGKSGSLSAQAAQVRVIARLSGAVGHARMQAVMDAIHNQAVARQGLERAQALTSLALIHAEAGARVRAGELGQLVQATTGLSSPEAALVHTELIVRGDLAAARVLHASGMYAESEAVLLRLGDYLL